MSRDPYDKIRDYLYEQNDCLLWMASDSAKAKCESPIEAILETAITCLCWGVSGGQHVVPTTDENEAMQPGGSNTHMGPFLFERQATVLGKYRADFLASVWTGKTWVRLVIECDGHDYHERTKAQAAHDRARDREMTLAGMTVMRFTGSEIYRDPIACARQIEAWVCAKMQLRVA